MTTIRANFLNDRQVYEFELPPGASASPELTGVLSLDGGLREIVYRQHAPGRGPAQSPAITHRFDLTGPSGEVGIYSPDDGSPALIAFWQLSRGTLQTFMDDQVACGSDLEAELATVVKSITIDTTTAGLPVVDVRPPLAWSTPRDPWHVNAVLLPPAEGGSWPAVTLTKEPPWRREGAASQRKTDAIRNQSVTNLLHVTAQVAGPVQFERDLRRYAARVAESMVPVP
jgi:hypothetical protein